MAKIKANKLENADVRFISLVKRGANRIPFRIIKQEKDMSIDLSKVWRTQKAEDSVPFVAAVVLQKADADLEALVAEAGFTIEFKQEDADGCVLYKQFDADLGEVTVVKACDDALLLLADFPATVLKGEETDAFTLAIKAEDALPPVAAAKAIFADLVAKSAARDVPAMAAAFERYETLLGHLPDEVTALVEKMAKRKDVNPQQGTDDYGDVEFADAKNKKYPIDTPEHVRAAWNYIHKNQDSDKYDPEDVKAIKSKIVAAWKKHIDQAGPPEAAAKADDPDHDGDDDSTAAGDTDHDYFDKDGKQKKKLPAKKAASNPADADDENGPAHPNPTEMQDDDAEDDTSDENNGDQGGKMNAKKEQRNAADPNIAPRTGKAAPAITDPTVADAEAKRRGQMNEPGTNVTDQENLDDNLKELSAASQNDADNNVVPSNVKNPLQKQENEMMDLLKAIKAELGELTGKVNTVEGRLDSVEAVAKSAEKAVKGTVTVGSDNTDRSFGVRARKSEKTSVFDDLQLFPGIE